MKYRIMNHIDMLAGGIFNLYLRLLDIVNFTSESKNGLTDILFTQSVGVELVSEINGCW